MMTFEQATALLSANDIISIMSDAERRYIWECVRVGSLAAPSLEVGAAYGGTTALMALAGGAVTIVENWQCGQRDVFLANMARLGVAVTEVIGDSTAVANQVGDAAFHVVLVDGEHTGEVPYRDLCAYAPKVAPGGWLLVDDVANGHDAVTGGALRWLAEAGGAFRLDWVGAFTETCSARHRLVKLCGFRREG